MDVEESLVVYEVAKAFSDRLIEEENARIAREAVERLLKRSQRLFGKGSQDLTVEDVEDLNPEIFESSIFPPDYSGVPAWAIPKTPEQLPLASGFIGKERARGLMELCHEILVDKVKKNQANE